MVSPEWFVEQLKNEPYEKLIEERNELIREIQIFEEKETIGDRSGGEWMIHPMPDVIYQCNLEYLAGLCKLMQERYNKEFVNGDDEDE